MFLHGPTVARNKSASERGNENATRRSRGNTQAAFRRRRQQLPLSARISRMAKLRGCLRRIGQDLRHRVPHRRRPHAAAVHRQHGRRSSQPEAGALLSLLRPQTLRYGDDAGPNHLPGRLDAGIRRIPHGGRLL